MALSDVFSDFASGLGKFIGASRNAMFSAGKAAKATLGNLRPRSSREKIRSIVFDELVRLIGEDAALAGTKLEERLKVMAEIILALQQRIDDLGVRGSVRDADMWKAMRSVKAAEILTNDERAILIRVFRQNVALQKPELVDATVGKA